MTILFCIVILFYLTATPIAATNLIQTIIPIIAAVFAFDLLIRIVFDILFSFRAVDSHCVCQQGKQIDNEFLFSSGVFEAHSALSRRQQIILVISSVIGILFNETFSILTIANIIITIIIFLLGFKPNSFDSTNKPICKAITPVTTMRFSILFCAVDPISILTQREPIGLLFLFPFRALVSQSCPTQRIEVALVKSNAIKIITAILITFWFELAFVIVFGFATNSIDPTKIPISETDTAIANKLSINNRSIGLLFSLRERGQIDNGIVSQFYGIGSHSVLKQAKRIESVMATQITIITINSNVFEPNLINTTNTPIIAIKVVLSIIGIGEVTSSSQKSDITLFEQTNEYFGECVHFGGVMCYYCEFYVTYSAIGSIFRNIVFLILVFNMLLSQTSIKSNCLIIRFSINMNCLKNIKSTRIILTFNIQLISNKYDWLNNLFGIIYNLKTYFGINSNNFQ